MKKKLIDRLANPLKIALPAVILSAALFTAACGRQPASPAISEGTSLPSAAEPARDEEAISAIAKELFTAHLDCMLNVMELGELPHEAPQDGSFIVPVTDDRFPDYAAFEAYLRGIYTDDVADGLLKNFPYEGESKYLEQDGRLYLNLNLCGGKGYYVDWSDCTIEIAALSPDRCDFIAVASVTWPAENPQPEEYRVEAQLLKTAEGWRMNTRKY